MTKGIATPPSAPGLGVVPDLDMLGDAVAVYERPQSLI